MEGSKKLNKWHVISLAGILTAFNVPAGIAAYKNGKALEEKAKTEQVESNYQSKQNSFISAYTRQYPYFYTMKSSDFYETNH